METAPSPRAARARRRSIVLVAAVGLMLVLAPAAVAVPGPSDPRVLVTTVTDAITPVIADHLADGLDRAEEEGDVAYVVELDTPGGLVESMRRITQRFLAAEVPVIVYVSPRGARAASAGAIITLAANVAAMAPGTVIGAATPVGLQGGDVERKVVNDAAALAESVAQLRGRDVGFARDAVREGRSAPAREALELGVVDFVAPSLDDLLEQVDGTRVEVADGSTVTLRTADAAIDDYDLGPLRRVLQLLADPNLAFLMLSIGALAILYELVNPGLGAAGLLGGTLIVLGLFALSVLPVNAVGVVFFVGAVGLLVAELLAPGVGVFAVLGSVALVLSGIFLFSGSVGVGVSLAVLLPTAAVVAGGSIVAGRLALRARTLPPTTGEGALLGQVVTVRGVDGGSGVAMVEGGWWSLRSTGRPLAVGERVRVVARDGLDLVVAPPDEPGGPRPDPPVAGHRRPDPPVAGHRRPDEARGDSHE
ncbi:MAG: NfeD family protein [Acidimicrobiales bacterium]